MSVGNIVFSSSLCNTGRHSGKKLEQNNEEVHPAYASTGFTISSDLWFLFKDYDNKGIPSLDPGIYLP